jgi:hypothetical protein
MLELKYCKAIHTLYWQQLRPGLIYLGGIQLSQGEIPELRNYPILTFDLLESLSRKYHFLKGKVVYVAEVSGGHVPAFLRKEILKIENQLYHLNQFRSEFYKEQDDLFKKFNMHLKPGELLHKPELVDQDFLIQDKLNSFSVSVPKINPEIPSFLNRLDSAITLGDLFSGRLNQKFNLPQDSTVQLHLVVDYSGSMDSMNKLDFVISSVHSFYKYISEFFLNTKLTLYIFSDNCITTDFPLKGDEIERLGTDFAPFIEKILKKKNSKVHNKVILFTDGEPNDPNRAYEYGQRLRKSNIDFTQIIFYMNDDLRYEFIDGNPSLNFFAGALSIEELLEGKKIKVLTDEELKVKKKKYFEIFTKFANSCGGNQVILNIFDFLKIITVETYDRYMGLLTLASPKEVEKINQETFQESFGKVKKYEFKKLSI